MTIPKQPTPDLGWLDEIDALVDLIARKIPDHHLKPKFISDCKQAIAAKLQTVELEAKIAVLKPIANINAKLDGGNYGEIDAQEDIEAYVDHTLAQLIQKGDSDENSSSL